LHRRGQRSAGGRRMKQITESRLCLCCGKSLEGTTENAHWHTSCSRRFFGAATIPQLDIDSKSLESYARIAINAGTTVTGVQKKMSLRLETEAGRKRLTLVGYPAGFILKPSVPEYPDLPELEHVLMSLADTAGIRTVPHALILMESDEIAYITRRIDRDAGRKIAMEDFCQLSQRLTEDKYKGSYDQCGKVISRYSKQSGLDMADFFFLILFCFVTGNADMHLKNFSLWETSSGYILAPSYDLVPTQLLIPEDNEETALTINGKKNRLSSRDFIALGESLLLHPKVIDSLLRKACALPDDLKNTPTFGLLPEKRQNELTLLIEERSVRLKGSHRLDSD